MLSIRSMEVFGPCDYFLHIQQKGWFRCSLCTTTVHDGRTCTEYSFNISKYIFDAFNEQLGIHERYKFYMYPRFIQIILNHKYPNLSKTAETLKLVTMGKRVFADMKTAKEKAAKTADENDQVDLDLYTPVHSDVFGHLIDPNYEPDEHGNDPPGYVVPGDESDEEDVQEEEVQHQQQSQQQQVQAPEDIALDIQVQVDDQNPEAEVQGELNFRSQDPVFDVDYR
jgi:hypothetical protein